MLMSVRSHICKHIASASIYVKHLVGTMWLYKLLTMHVLLWLYKLYKHLFHVLA